MSTVEVTVVECDVRECGWEIVADMAVPKGWVVTDTIDLCDEHARASGLSAERRVERTAPPAAPTAGTTSTAPITLALSARDAVWVAAALEHDLRTCPSPHRDAPARRELLRALSAQIEDYARSQP